VCLFLLCTPASANSLVLRPHRGLVSGWYVADALGTGLAFFLVLLQYAVSESLYGIDGDNAPYDDSLHMILQRIQPDPSAGTSIPRSLV
jgi:hypothetical protein